MARILSPKEFHPLMALAADKAAEGLLCLESEGQILYANDAATRTLAQSTDVLSQRTIFEIAPEMNPSLWQELWKEIRHQGSFAFEFSLSADEGQMVQVEMSAHFLKPAGRELACVFFHDIEERKRLQTLEQEFVSTASHELRTPLTVIREGVAQVLEGLRGDINPSQHRSLTIALSGIDRLGRMIDDLLDISKMESGKAVLRRDPLDFVALVREGVASFQSLAADRGLELRQDFLTEPILFYGDRDRLVQVLSHLINNSFKFTEKGHIQISVRLNRREIRCSVSDTGMGLVSGGAEKIFNKFEQLEPLSVTGEKGTGLGLSICRGIIELHKGRILAESAGPGRGTCVTFVLPQQTGCDIFCEQLAPMLRHVSRRGGSLSTIRFQLIHKGSAFISETQRASALASLEQVIRNHSGRTTDFVVRDKTTLYFALESMIKREAIRIAEQILKVFQESLVQDNRQSLFLLTYSVMAFPEEEVDQDVFLKKVCHAKGPR